MTNRILEAAVGPNGAFELWFVIDTADRLNHALGLVEKYPRRWRIFEG